MVRAQQDPFDEHTELVHGPGPQPGTFKAEKVVVSRNEQLKAVAADDEEAHEEASSRHAKAVEASETEKVSRKSAGLERKPGQQQMKGKSGTAVGLPGSIDNWQTCQTMTENSYENMPYSLKEEIAQLEADLLDDLEAIAHQHTKHGLLKPEAADACTAAMKEAIAAELRTQDNRLLSTHARVRELWRLQALDERAEKSLQDLQGDYAKESQQILERVAAKVLKLGSVHGKEMLPKEVQPKEMQPKEATEKAVQPLELKTQQGQLLGATPSDAFPLDGGDAHVEELGYVLEGAFLESAQAHKLSSELVHGPWPQPETLNVDEPLPLNQEAVAAEHEAASGRPMPSDIESCNEIEISGNEIEISGNEIEISGHEIEMSGYEIKREIKEEASLERESTELQRKVMMVVMNNTSPATIIWHEPTNQVQALQEELAKLEAEFSESGHSRLREFDWHFPQAGGACTKEALAAELRSENHRLVWMDNRTQEIQQRLQAQEAKFSKSLFRGAEPLLATVEAKLLGRGGTPETATSEITLLVSEAAPMVEEAVTLEHASEELQGGAGVANDAVLLDGLARTPEPVLLDARAPNHASEELQGDKAAMLAAVRKDGLALKRASPELREDTEVVLAAVRQNGRALEHASAELRGDKKVVITAVCQHHSACLFASDELLNEGIDFMIDSIDKRMSAYSRMGVMATFLAAFAIAQLYGIAANKAMASENLVGSRFVLLSCISAMNLVALSIVILQAHQVDRLVGYGQVYAAAFLMEKTASWRHLGTVAILLSIPLYVLDPALAILATSDLDEYTGAIVAVSVLILAAIAVVGVLFLHVERYNLVSERREECLKKEDYLKKLLGTKSLKQVLSKAVMKTMREKLSRRTGHTFERLLSGLGGQNSSGNRNSVKAVL